MSGETGYNSPVDEPPGKDGHQGQANPDEVFPVPEWPPGANPPGTHPPVEPENDPATTPIPGMIPRFDTQTPPVEGETAPPMSAPGLIDVPYVSQAGDTLTCTMGNWTGEPTEYGYVWTIAGVAIETSAANDYIVNQGDIGGAASCVVTATNAIGSTEAPPSNEIVIADPGA
jgi:hypothetical protein